MKPLMWNIWWWCFQSICVAIWSSVLKVLNASRTSTKTEAEINMDIVITYISVTLAYYPCLLTKLFMHWHPVTMCFHCLSWNEIFFFPSRGWWNTHLDQQLLQIQCQIHKILFVFSTFCKFLQQYLQRRNESDMIN